MFKSPKYDYILSGAGCAGLSLAMHMIDSKKFSEKKILIVDKDLKQSNDRTWCFWQKQNGLFENIVYKKWDLLSFFGDHFSKQIEIDPYQYKMIRAIDFYEYCLNTIQQHKNFEICFEKVDSIFSGEQTGITINGKKIFADYVFNSILFEKPQLGQNELWLLQHFKGWIIETEENAFDKNTATLMDFRIDQKFGTAFCYVLPLSSHQALIEYTLFSKDLLQPKQYDEGLQFYIENILNLQSYKILDEEFGTIPMTNFKFPTVKNNIVNIGTAGGQTKGSSGYTFNFIQKHSKALVNALIKRGKPFIKNESNRFNFYDSVLLNVLNDGKISGKEIFTDLFKKNPVDKVFKFLDNETSLAEELKVISSLPTLPFLKAGVRQFI